MGWFIDKLLQAKGFQKIQKLSCTTVIRVVCMNIEVSEQHKGVSERDKMF